MSSSNYDEYISSFKNAIISLNIKKGDILYIASDIAGLLMTAVRELKIRGKEEQDAFFNKIIDTLKDIVGEDGTLLFPVYNWGFCKGETFDYHKTQGTVGALNNFVLNNRSDFIRTRHALYSFMVWGKDAKYLYSMTNQEAWGKTSPFAYLHHNGAKHLCINTTLLSSLTFKHYVEQATNVPYRHHKFFIGHYIDENGVDEIRTYSQYVRDLDVSLKSTQSEEFFEAHNACFKTTFKGCPLSATLLDKAFDLLQDDLLHNNGANLYSFTDYTLPASWAENDSYEIGLLREKRLLTKL